MPIIRDHCETHPSAGIEIIIADHLDHCKKPKIRVAKRSASIRVNPWFIGDHCGVEICKSAGYVAKKVADPTMLLEKEDYLSLASKGTALIDSPYVFIYSLNIGDSSDIRFDELKEFCDKNCLNIVATPGDGYCQGKELYGKNAKYSYATIEQWLYNVANSSLVVTTSFHGIVLSLILRKPFVYTPIKGIRSDTNDRISGLLSDLKLENRILKDTNNYEQIINSEIDWINVNHIKTILKDQSLVYLRNSLDF